MATLTNAELVAALMGRRRPVAPSEVPGAALCVLWPDVDEQVSGCADVSFVAARRVG